MLLRQIWIHTARLSALSLATFNGTVFAAQEPPTESLGTIEVEAERAPLYDIDDTQQRRIDAEAAAALSGTTSTDYYKSLSLAPSVTTETHDAYALTTDQNTLRVRGQAGDTFSRLSTTVEGVPFGVNVGNSGTGYLIDMENLSQLSFTTGVTPVGSGLGMGDTAGALNLSLARPTPQSGIRAGVAGGSDAYRKLFVRADSGEFANGVALFLSGSSAANDKWRSEGEITRDNLTAMTTWKVNETLSMELFGAKNSFDRHEYRPLDYDQTQDIGEAYEVEYLTELTGDPALDPLYYDFNRQSFDEYATYLRMEAKLGGATLTLKPYAFGSDGDRLVGDTAKKAVKKITLEQEALGAVAQVDYPLADGTLYAGWWYQRLDSTPPPNLVKFYTIEADGSLSYKNTAMLNEIEERVSNSPYVGYDSRFGGTRVHAGLRYMMFRFPAVTGYSTAGLDDLSYDDALAASSGVQAGMEVDAAESNLWLPSLMLERSFTNGWSAAAGYARNYANPWQGPLWSVYKSNMATFTGAGITLQDLWDDLELETADNLELTGRYDSGTWSLRTTLFYGLYDNKQVTVYDPSLNLSYYRSNASATSRGAELELAWDVVPNLSLFASAYYNRFEFDEDILLATDTYLEAAGKQIPDVAKVGAKAGITYRKGALSITPMARYVGERYGDAGNQERVSPYTVLDLSARYAILPKRANLTLAVNNLLDREYIGVIDNGLDDTRSGSTAYYVGAPRSVVAGLNVEF